MLRTVRAFHKASLFVSLHGLRFITDKSPRLYQKQTPWTLVICGFCWSYVIHNHLTKWNFGYWGLTHWLQKKAQGCDDTHVFLRGVSGKETCTLKAGICFQLVMARIQHKNYACQSIPRGFKELLLKRETKRWLIRCWNDHPSGLRGCLFSLHVVCLYAEKPTI